jgi:hypothetical protein
MEIKPRYICWIVGKQTWVFVFQLLCCLHLPTMSFGCVLTFRHVRNLNSTFTNFLRSKFTQK